MSSWAAVEVESPFVSLVMKSKQTLPLKAVVLVRVHEYVAGIASMLDMGASRFEVRPTKE